MMARLAALLLTLLALPAFAEEKIVIGLSQDEVAISASFTGSEILIFGAIRREVPLPTDSTLGVLITLSGPQVPLSVWRKERRLGIWVNTEQVEVDLAPSYYAVASSGPMNEVLMDIEDVRHSISVPRAIRAVGVGIAGSESFIEALIRIREKEGTYQILEGAIDLEQDTLFRTSVSMPSDLIEGDYVTRIFLTRDGIVIDEFDTVIPVNKVGLERWLYELANEFPFVYGLLAIAIAMISGWGASAAFAALRR